jgi:hypothetical protein
MIVMGDKWESWEAEHERLMSHPCFQEKGNETAQTLLRLIWAVVNSPNEEERKRRHDEYRAYLRSLRPNPPEHPSQHPARDQIDAIIDAMPGNYPELSRRDGYVWLVWSFEKNVTNSGIEGFLFNSSGDYALETLEALKAIGASQSYKLLRQACDLFPEGRPNPNQEKRFKQLKAIRDSGRRFDDLDEGSIEIDLYQLLLDYWINASPETK